MKAQKDLPMFGLMDKIRNKRLSNLETRVSQREDKFIEV